MQAYPTSLKMPLTEQFSAHLQYLNVGDNRDLSGLTIWPLIWLRHADGCLRHLPLLAHMGLSPALCQPELKAACRAGSKDAYPHSRQAYAQPG